MLQLLGDGSILRLFSGSNQQTPRGGWYEADSAFPIANLIKKLSSIYR